MLELTPKQRTFAEAVFSGRYSYLLFGGAIRGGKTLAVLALLWVLCKIYPGSRWAIVRKDLPTLRRNTIPTFNKFAPRPFVGQINQGTWTARCANGSEIVFFPESVDRDPDLDRWKGLEVNGFALEECNELGEASFEKSIERSGSWLCPGDNQPPPLVLLTCNPSGNWVKRTFYDPQQTGALAAPYYFLRATILDNPHLTEGYLRGLAELKKKNPATHKRFVEGDWEAADEPDQLIQFAWVLHAANNVEKIPGKRGLGVDVARYGDDKTTLAHRVGNALVDLEYHEGLSIDRTSDIVGIRIAELIIDADRVHVDGVGLGAGVVDNLHRDGYAVIDVISGAKAIERKNPDGSPASFYKFPNLRSQMWWEFREALRADEVCIDIDDPKLFEDLTAPRYSVTGDKMLKVESKDEFRKRLGRSPDAGDAVVYAWAELEDLTFRLNAPVHLTTEDKHGNVIGAKKPAWDCS